MLRRRYYNNTSFFPWKFSIYIFLFIVLISVPLFIFLALHHNHSILAHIKVNATVTVNLSSPDMVSQFATGITHTQNDNALGTNKSAIAAEKKLIQSSAVIENVPLMGWGSPDPEPAPGQYSWGVLDSRIEFMHDTGTTEMITLCCAPGWMRPSQYTDDWQYLETAPSPAHYQDFADLAKQVAERYPEVKYFQVWNELKGFYDASTNQWDYAGYTTLYNMVYDAIKSVRPDAKIGGPYISIDNWSTTNAGGWPAHDSALYNQPWGTIDQRSLDVISYWLAHKDGADFIIIDGGTGTKDGTWTTDEFTAANYFPAIYQWIRQQPDGGATLPIGWAEWYPSTPQNYTNINHYNAVLAYDLIVTLKSGYWYALLWGTQGDKQGLNAFPASIMTSNGQPTPEYYTLRAFKDCFGAGTKLYKTSSSSPAITAIASDKKTMLVNHLGTTQVVRVNSVTVILNGYQVLIMNTPDA